MWSINGRNPSLINATITRTLSPGILNPQTLLQHATYSHTTYSLAVTRRHADDVDWKDALMGLRNLRVALEQNNSSSCRMANSADLLGLLPQNKMAELVTNAFQNSNVVVTLCHGKIEVPPPELREKIIAEYHGSLIGGHKGVTKTYRPIRERYS